MEMSEKRLLSKDEIKELCDGEEKEFSNTNELLDYIENDINRKQILRKFLIKHNKAPKWDLGDNVKEIVDRNEKRKKAFLDNFYIENDSNANSADYTSMPDPFDHLSLYEKIIKDMEENDYKKIIAESDEVFSSIEIKLTETSVIENGELSITWRKEALDTTKALIMEKNGSCVLAVGYLTPVDNADNKFWVIFDNPNYISYSSFEGKSQVRLVVFTLGNNLPHSCIADMNYIKMRKEIDKPLCIDFGTSNTTVGTYGIKTKRDIEIVKFVDVTVSPHNTSANMLPTVVYVEDCSNKDDIRYLFGYEALKRIEQDEHYEFKASAFFEIKKWMSSPESMEEIKDNNNNTVKIERKKIIKAYIDYVIEKSEQFFGVRFEKIHFSAPVKLKSLFIKTFKELYNSQKIVLNESESIDEAFSIVYNQIINIIDNEKEEVINDKDKSILILDCGGGTTDLANCTFRFTKEDGFTNKLSYTTRFENGNSNFGGNNITYRVMQLLKIKIAAGFDSTIRKDAMLLIDKTEDQILNIIEISDKNEAYNSDECSNEIYREFVDEYNKCEGIIPTKFAKELNLDSYDIKCRKRNFYCMWRLAEKIKIEFFNSINVQFDFGDQGVKELLVDSSNDYFYVNKENILTKTMDPLKNVTITNKDVERIICGDIYGLLYGLMKNGDLSDNTNEKREVENFDYYKLSGQSCKISMFKELLKEYIPGRKLRPHFHKDNNKDNNSETLKLECLEGCIKFTKDQRGHELEIIPNPQKPKIIYNVFIHNEHGDCKKIFDCTNLEPEKTLFEIFSPQANEMSFLVKNKDDIVEKALIMCLEDQNSKDDFDSAEKLIEVILEEYDYNHEYIEKVVSVLCNAADTTKTKDDAKIVFVLPSPDYYGSTILLVHRKHNDGNTKYKYLYSMNVPFENPDKTFFDGKR